MGEIDKKRGGGFIPMIKELAYVLSDDQLLNQPNQPIQSERDEQEVC